MHSFKFIFVLLALVSFVMTSEDSAEESAIEELKPETVEDMESTEGSAAEESAKLAEESSEEQTETIAVLFEEVDPKDLNETEALSESEQSSVVKDPEGVTAEYNGFDSSPAADESGSTFSCYNRSFGQYADVSQECRVFHMCYPFFNDTANELLYQRITFLCDDNSVFDQKRFICVDNSTVEHKCHESEALYQRTNDEYLIRVFGQSKPAEPKEPTDSTNGWFSWMSRNN